MATIRRLSDDDVRAIFESLHHNRLPPPHLRFQIVPVGPNGLKLSPPSFEFEDGLYVLLRPQKKKKNILLEEQPKAPAHLADYVIPNLPPAHCPWSLSGPQFPQPTAIQQRYCYPKGNPGYSCRKGGALWTMYGADGTEDLEFRLLHVYYSAKRAVNRGMKAAAETACAISPSPSKRARTQHHYSSATTLPAPSLCMASPVTASVASSKSFSFDMASPLDDDDCVSLSPIFSHQESVQNNVTPMSDIFNKFHPTISPPQPLHHRHHSTITADTFPNDTHYNNNMSPPISSDKSHHPTESSPPSNHAIDDLRQSWEPFPLDMEDDFLDFSWALSDESDVGDHIALFANRLEVLHESLKEKIFLANESEQGPLLTILSSWAKQVALTPLGKIDVNPGENVSSIVPHHAV